MEYLGITHFIGGYYQGWKILESEGEVLLVQGYKSSKEKNDYILIKAIRISFHRGKKYDTWIEGEQIKKLTLWNMSRFEALKELRKEVTYSPLPELSEWMKGFIDKQFIIENWGTVLKWTKGVYYFFPPVPGWKNEFSEDEIIKIIGPPQAFDCGQGKVKIRRPSHEN